jgi:hypothetical protein
MRLTIFFDEYKTMAKPRTMKISPMVRWVLEVEAIVCPTNPFHMKLAFTNNENYSSVK